MWRRVPAPLSSPSPPSPRRPLRLPGDSDSSKPRSPTTTHGAPPPRGAAGGPLRAARLLFRHGGGGGRGWLRVARAIRRGAAAGRELQGGGVRDLQGWRPDELGTLGLDVAHDVQAHLLRRGDDAQGRLPLGRRRRSWGEGAAAAARWKVVAAAVAMREKEGIGGGGN